jgi:multidrug efflux pump subunit AcrA (membrane-fusion protein)
MQAASAAQVSAGVDPQRFLEPLRAPGIMKLFATAGSRREALASSDATVASARAQLAQAEAALGKTTVRAPVAGTVVRRSVAVGELVAGLMPRPLLAIADLGRLQVRIELDESDLARVQPGMAAYVTSMATGELRASGVVKQTAFELGRRKVPVDDPRARTDTRVLEGVIALEQPGPFKLQQRVDVSIVLSSVKGVLRVPVRGVHHDRAQPYVRLAGVLSTREQPVTLGVSNGDLVEVKEGVTEGQRLVMDPAIR